MRPSKDTIDTQSKSGVAPSRSMRSFSALPLQKELDDFTKKIEVERRKYMDQEKVYTSLQKALQTQKLLLGKLKLDIQNRNVKAIPFKTKCLSHSSRTFISNDNIKFSTTKLQDSITKQRKQMGKYKEMCGELNLGISRMEEEVISYNQRIESLRSANEMIKDDILKFKEKSKEDATIFSEGLMAISSNYFNQRKQIDRQRKEGKVVDLETGALDVLRRRLKGIIDQNANKMSLIESYKKTSNEISRMFRIISNHTGKQDIMEIVEEFVHKEKIIFKLEEQEASLEQQVIEWREEQEPSAQAENQSDIQNWENEVLELEKQIEDYDSLIKEKREEREQLAKLFQGTLNKLNGSKRESNEIEIDMDESDVGSTTQHLFEMLGEIQKHIEKIKPHQNEYTIKIDPLQISDDDIDSLSQTEKEKKPDLHLLSQTQGVKQQLLKYQDLVSLANEAINKIKDGPTHKQKEKEKTKLSN